MTRQTNWDKYYQNPFFLTKISRKITENILLKLFDRYLPSPTNFSIIELGGANSAMFDSVYEKYKPSTYYMLDNNQLGLDMFEKRLNQSENVRGFKQDVLQINFDKQADLVFSTGLIEHFNQTDTKKAISAHYQLTKPGGLIVITFPTPTFLYRFCRQIAELVGAWIFHDERPLRFKEVTATIQELGGELQESLIIWPILFTQGVVVVKKPE